MDETYCDGLNRPRIKYGRRASEGYNPRQPFHFDVEKPWQSHFRGRRRDKMDSAKDLELIGIEKTGTYRFFLKNSFIGVIMF